MDAYQKDRDFILQSDWLRKIEGNFGGEAWVPLYRSERTQSESIGIFCALIPKSKSSKILKRDSWDLQAGDGSPGICTRYRDDKPYDTYHRYGDDSGIEPLVFIRSFHGLREPGIELGEEFRLYLNLYDDRTNRRFIRISDDGNEEDVVRLTNDGVLVRMREIKEFISVKQMHLALYFEVRRFSGHTLEELGLREEDRPHRSQSLAYSFIVRDARSMSFDDRRTMSRLMGKKLIAPRPRQGGELPVGPLVEHGREPFIIGVDQDGEPISYTSDPDRLGDYFGGNPGAPNYLTPVFFRREVLGKYYAQPDKYSVEDGLLRCSGLWSMGIDNNHGDYVVVHLGDLGRDLPPSEQGYWRSFNVPPDGGFSEVAFRRGILGLFTDSQRADLIFKSRFKGFQEAWERSYGWPLFRPLGSGDAHLMTTLRIPLSEGQSEFDGQVLALAKILVDSLNEEELAKSGIAIAPDTKGISKLDAFLGMKDFPHRSDSIQFLRDLYSLRSSGSGHRKGSNYEKAAAKFALSETGLIKGFEGILKQAVVMLDRLLDLAT